MTINPKFDYAEPYICPANDNDPRIAELSREREIEAYRAACAEWRAREKRISAANKAYYGAGKQVSADGAPCWKAKWWGELGNDAEYREAAKPRTSFKSAYYEGGCRMVIDGTPVRMAAHVKRWKAGNKAALCKGSDRYGLMLDRPAKNTFVSDKRLPRDLFSWRAK